MATRISELTGVDPKTIDDKTKLSFASADTQVASPGTSYGVTAADMHYIVNNETITSTTHGLVALDEGKPLYGIAIVDDTVGGEYGMWLMLELIDVDNFKIVPPGVAMDIPIALIEDGASYDVSVKGYELYWDESAAAGAGQYVATQPGDSDHPHVIHVISVGATTFRAKLIERQLDWSLDQGGAMIHPNNYVSGGATVGHVVATGNGTTDSAAFAAAVAAYDIVRIDDNAAALELDDGTLYDLATTWLEGHSTQRSRVNLSGGTQLRWGDYGDFGTKLTQTVGTNGWEDCAVADDGGTITATEVLDVGDIVLVTADNDLGIRPHFSGGVQSPLEIGRIAQIEDGTAADQAGRLALTGLLVGERIFQIDNSTVYELQDSGKTITGVDTGSETLTTSAAHDLAVDDLVNFTGSDLPAPLVAGTEYHVITTATTTTFQVSTTQGGAAVNLTDAGSGTINYEGWDELTGDIKYVLEVRLKDTYAAGGDGIRYYKYVDGSGDPVLSLGGGMRNLDFTGSSNPAGTTTGFLIYHDHYWEAHNVWWQNTGSLSLFGCYQARLYDCKCLGQTDPGAAYGMAYVGCSGLSVYRFEAQKCRHFATSGGWGSNTGPKANQRWGTNNDTEFVHCTGYLTGVESGSTVGWDTHPEGLGVTYYRCTAHLGGDNQIFSSSEWNLYGFQSRSRNTRLVECRVFGTNDQKHIGVRNFGATDMELVRCEQRGGAIAYWAASQSGDPCERSIIRDCSFDDLSKNAILLDGGEDAIIERTTVTNSGGNATGYPGSTFSAITFSENAGENVGGIVRDCYLPKASNTASIRYPDTLTISEIKFFDNRTTGYATDLGLDAALANTATLLAEYDGQNNHNTQGTSILSTGETGGSKFLREDGDGTSSWQSVAGLATGYDLATDWIALDGVTDDTANLRTAIYNSDNPLFIPAGTCLVTDTIVIPPRKKIYGAGRDTIIKADATLTGKPVFDIGRVGDYTTPTHASDYITATNHLMIVGQEVRFYDYDAPSPAGGGTPQGGMGQGTTYYVAEVVDANNFKISASSTLTPIFDVTSEPGNGTYSKYWSRSEHVELSSLTIIGTAYNHNATGIYSGASSRFSLSDVYIDSISKGAVLGYELTDVPPFGSWLLEVRNLWITNCEELLACHHANGSRVFCNMENQGSDRPTRYFDVKNSSGSTFTLTAEGQYQTASSTIDKCKGTSFDGMWLEYSGISPDPDVPFLSVGENSNPGECSQISMRGISCFAQLDTAILFDEVDGVDGHGSFSTGLYGHAFRSTSNAKNINIRRGRAGTHAYASTVDISNMPMTNYFTDPFFEQGIDAAVALAPADAAHRVNLTGTLGDTGVVEETTIVLPGRSRSIKVIANSGFTNARVIFELPLVGELARLKGKVCTLGAWIYAPSAYYDISTESEVYPYARILTDGTVAIHSVNYNRTQHIPDNWAFVTWESANNAGVQQPIPSDASFIKLDFYVQNDSTVTVGGQYFLIGGIMVCPGGFETMDRMREGHVTSIGVRNDYSATGTPGVNDDAEDLWGIGSIWTNGTTIYRCVDPTPGAASWIQTA